MIVVDASALFQVLDRGGAGRAIEARLFTKPEPICAPYLIDAEILNVLHKHVLTGRMSEPRARLALGAYASLTLIRVEHLPLLTRAFSLRDRLSAYDALYVALADSLSATLITCDGRLARAAAEMVLVEAY